MATAAAPEQPLGRPVFSGSITFGLVAVPVKLFPATVSHNGPVLHQVDKADGSRIRQKRYCELEDREVDLDEIAKGWDAADGRMVILTDDDMAGLPVPSKRIIDVMAFVPAADLDPLLLDKPYYVDLGDKAPAKPYALLRDVMADSGLVAVTKITIRERETLAVLRVVDNLLVLQTLRWPDEIRPTAGIRAPSAEDADLHGNEIKMAIRLGESIGRDFHLDEERDQYVVALEALLRSKIGEGEAPTAVEAVTPAAPVVDLMAALQESIAASKAARGETPAKPAAKKTATKKTAAKRAPHKAS
jgi:DNA end-binding protein Ku